MQVIFKDEAFIDINGGMWDLTIYDSVVNIDGQLVNTHSMVRLQTPEEQAYAEGVKQKELRISELKEAITNKKLLDIDCTAEQVELKELLSL